MRPTFLLALVAPLVACTASSDGPASGPSGDSDTAAEQAEVDLFGQREPLVISHAGGLGLGPDHTLETYQRGLDAGGDVLELDVHTTADGVVVSIHDSTVDRTTSGTGRVHDLTLAELQALDAAYHWSPDGGETFPERGKGHVVPSVMEIFEAFPRAWYVIEIKQTDPPMEQALLSLLDEYELRSHTIVASFSDDVIQRFRKLAPEVRTALATDEVRRFVLAGNGLTRDTYEAPGHALQVPVSYYDGQLEVITEDLIRNARRFDLLVHAWTINDRDEMDRLLAMGVNGLITDYPDRARAAIDARGGEE